MTKVTQISAAAVLAVFASTAFVSTAEAGAKRVYCKETVFSIFRTACEQKKRRYLQRPTYPQAESPVNFRSRTAKELSLDTSEGEGGGSGGRGGRGGKP